jgi:hypothetical protein
MRSTDLRSWRSESDISRPGDMRVPFSEGRPADVRSSGMSSSSGVVGSGRIERKEVYGVDIKFVHLNAVLISDAGLSQTSSTIGVFERKVFPISRLHHLWKEKAQAANAQSSLPSSFPTTSMLLHLNTFFLFFSFFLLK